MSDRDITEPIKFLKFAELVGTIAKRSKPRTNEQRKADRKQERTWSPAYEVFYNFSRYIQAKPIRASTTSIVFRFLFPEEDHKRKFGLRADGLISEIGDVLRISKSRVDALENDITGKQVQTLLDATWSGNDEYTGNLSIFEVDELLNQLASTSPWSHSSFSKKSFSGHDKPTRKNILRSLYRQMSPFEAAVLSQIILKDLRGLLYPQLELDPTAALMDYNTKAIQVLTKESAMRAWDPSNRMNRVYRARWDVDDAADAFESGREVGPEIGFQIAVPKSQKGRSAKHALSFFSNSSEVWAETKYDGERAQIHVQVGSSGRPQIKIFSKSKRDSTQDRKAIHPIILKCLGFGRPGKKPRIGKSVILDAEMVACEGTKILEFWRIRKLIRDTAGGIRRRGSKKDDEEYLVDDSTSESSLVSSSEGQHLGLVFFDCMYLEDESLVQQSYCRRREILEELIIPESGRAMLADRYVIDLQSHSQACDLSSDDGDETEDDDSDGTSARRVLHKILARRLAVGEEGLVLKAADSEYNEPSKPWVKLKKDYIEGLGDTVDLVLLAAACVPDRALELRVPLTTMTTFYVGAQTNKQDTDNDPTAKPHFYIYFTAAYGLSRAELETLNFFMKTNSIACAKIQSLPRDELEYTYRIYDKLARPELMLRAPIAAELFGDRFTVAEGSKQYELRWPRITKFFRDRERSWRDCISLQALHKQALEAMGRVSLEEEARKSAEIIFNRRDSPTKDSADRTTASGVHARIEMWRARVAEADKPKKARHKRKERKGSSEQAVLTSSRKRKDAEVGGPVKRQKICNADGDGIPRNLSEWSISHLSFPIAGSRSSRDQRPSQHPGKRSRVDNPLSHSVFSERVSATNPTINYSSRNIGNALEGKQIDITPSKELLFKDGTIPLQTTANSNMIHPVFHHDFRLASQSAQDENTQPTAGPVTAPSSSHSPLELSLAERVHYPSPPTSPLKPKETSGTEHTKSSSVRLDASRTEVHVDEFFKDAVLWVPPSKARFRSSGLPSIVKSATLLNGLEAFFNACRWNPKNNHLINAAPPTRGIVLLDHHDEYGPRWMRNLLDGIRARMTIWKPTDEPRKMIWIFDRRTEFKKGTDRRSQALYVFE